MRIRHAQPSDRDQLTEMRTLLWPESSIEEQRCEVEALMAPASPASLPTTVPVSYTHLDVYKRQPFRLNRRTEARSSVG